MALKTVNLGGLWRAEAQGLALELTKLRAGIRHNPTSGSGAEEALRALLREKLPSSIGVTQGQVFDSVGNISRQSDVILYDANRTPLVFESAQGGTNLVPAEGAIAVIEVKSSFSASDLESVVANMSEVKKLQKSAYFEPVSIVERTVDPYELGQSSAIFPITYSLFAYESADLEGMIPTFDTLNGALPVDKRIDNACFLDKGCLLNLQPAGNYSPLPGPQSTHFFGASQDALLLWYAAAASIWLQAWHHPINLLAYVHSVGNSTGQE